MARTLKAAAFGLAFASITSVAQAQDIALQGFSLGVDVTYANQKLEDESGSGVGIGARFGYGVGQMWQPYVNLSSTKVDVEGGDYGLGQIDLGTRVNFVRGASRLVPFADLALSFRGISTDLEDATTGETAEFEASSTGLTLGGGARYFMNSQWAFDGGLQYTLGKYGDAKLAGESLEGEVDGNALRLNVGFSWYPMARR